MGPSTVRLSFLNRLRGLRRSTLNWHTCVRVTIVRHCRAATCTAHFLHDGTLRSKEADRLPLLLVLIAAAWLHSYFTDTPNTPSWDLAHLLVLLHRHRALLRPH
jgi:hypothetical protein